MSSFPPPPPSLPPASPPPPPPPPVSPKRSGFPAWGGRASGTMCMVVPDDGGTFALFATVDYNEFVWFGTS